MKKDSDLHRMEALFRDAKVPYQRRAVHVEGKRWPLIDVEGSTFMFTPEGTFKLVAAHVALKPSDFVETP